MGNPDPIPSSRSTARLVAAFAAFASTAALCAAASVGDFAPLAKGNTWVYVGAERMLCKSLWDNISVIRSLIVDSTRDGADGMTYYMSYRDSIHWTEYGRWGSSIKPADSARTGRFIILEKSGMPELRVAPLGAGSVPSEMAFFFRSHIYSEDWITPGIGASAGGEVRYRRAIRKTVTDNAAYVKDVGMIRFHHDYNVYNTNGMTAPERIVAYRLISFNGTAFATEEPKPFSEAESHGDPDSPLDFAPILSRDQWNYAGIRRVDSAGRVSQDSIYRTLTVTGGSPSAGDFTVALQDSLYARLRADQPLYPQIRTAEFRVLGNTALSGGGGGIGIWDPDADPSWSDPLRFFNGKRYPARDVQTMSFPDADLPVVVIAEKSPGILVDTSIYAEGVGLVRRSKTLNDGRIYTEEFRLVGFRGKPFHDIPKSLATHALPSDRRTIRKGRRSGQARLPVRIWRGRDAAGKAL